ncbi:hypothetical protein LXL04_034200 [Taraxacum kok-saghyz]
MSLVDYASSDEEDEELGREEERNKDNLVISHTKPPQQNTNPPNDSITKSTFANLPMCRKSTRLASQQPEPFRLPDASFLLDSPSLPSNMSGAFDHSSRVAAAMAVNASRKRDSAPSSSSSYPRGKIPKGNLPHSKNVPETARGLLCPPQLSGRSNVVTEDINKLFTKRSGSEPSSSRPTSE